MNRSIQILVILCAFCILADPPAFGMDTAQEKSWVGKLSDGTEISETELKIILEIHQIWLKSEKKEGAGADLSGANLSNANLNNADLRYAILWKTDLSNADLSGANLSNANLNNADLRYAILWKTDLSNADLSKANLSHALNYEANLSSADLSFGIMSDAELSGANLSNTNLMAVNFSNAELAEANLNNADLSFSNLSKANLLKANLIDAKLMEADLSNASLWHANLSNAYLYSANLSNAILAEANLSNADLTGADLSNALLVGADLRCANLINADLTNCHLNVAYELPVFYEPKHGSVPYIPSMVGLTNLEKLTFNNHPNGLVALRHGFNIHGYRVQERKITYALRHSQTQNSIRDSLTPEAKNYYRWVEGQLSLYLFEYTSKWGMSPGRPLFILISIMLLFSFVYMFSLIGINKRDGIWKVWISDRVRSDLGETKPKKPLTYSKAYQIWGYGFYFSLLSAFNIGWRELNVGNWISRIHPREYTLRASGWVRTVSGIQSLISVYLLALAVLTYFGRPFDHF